jgi:hypothetical protein
MKEQILERVKSSNPKVCKKIYIVYMLMKVYF